MTAAEKPGRRGRPPLEPGDGLTVRIYMCVTPLDMIRIRTRAKELEIPIGTFVRRAVQAALAVGEAKP